MRRRRARSSWWAVATLTVAGASGFAQANTGVAPASEAAAAAETSGRTWSEWLRPAPLSPDEEASPIGASLARRYNPAMAFVTRDIWPVDVSYAWADGSDLVARVVGPDGQVLSQTVAREHADLVNNEWGDLPDRDDDGNRIEYAVNAPGDDRLERGVSGWVRRWRAIMGGDAALQQPPAALDYPPTQYAHLFWWNRERGLLAVQYWFYYPYNEWINHHEGDWEHVTVILRGPSRLRSAADFRPVGYQFFFHGYSHEPAEVIRVAGSDPHEDHVMIYTGGLSRFFAWNGFQSGGSYPLPALFPGAGGGIGTLKPGDDTSHPARFIRAEDFKIVMLPEPDRLDVSVRPELAWLRLAFFAGQAQVFRNPLSLNGLSSGSTPRQPARQEAWNAEWTPPPWPGTAVVETRSLALPRGWRALDPRPTQPHDTVWLARKPPRTR